MRLAFFLFFLMCFETVKCADLEYTEIPLSIPYTAPSGVEYIMYGHICIPKMEKLPRLAVINHGSPIGGNLIRETMKPLPCGSPLANWFMKQGYAVSAVLRVGYGASEGQPLEGQRCATADYYAGGIETAREIDTIVKYLISRPYVNRNNVVVVGISVGGWGVIAYASMDHPAVTKIINFSGGRGGHFKGTADLVCSPSKLLNAVMKYGSHSITPMLWIYAMNDSFFPPELASSIYKSYTDNGGHAVLHMLPSIGFDGHDLTSNKKAYFLWSSFVERYIQNP